MVIYAFQLTKYIQTMEPLKRFSYWLSKPFSVALAPSTAGNCTSLHFVSLQGQPDPGEREGEDQEEDDGEPGVEEDDGEKREEEVEEGGGKHHVQRVAREFLLFG